MFKYLMRFNGYIQSAGTYFFSSIVVALIGLLLNPIFSMYLSHRDFAIIGYYSSFSLLLCPLLHFNLYSYYSRQYYYIDVSKREKLAGTVLISSMILGGIILMLFMSIFYILHKKIDIDFPFFPYAVLIFVQIYINNIIIFYLSKLRIQRKAKLFAIISISNCIVTAILSLVFVVYFKQGAAGKLLGILLSTIFFSIYSFRHSIIHYKIDFVLLRNALKFTWPIVLSNILFYFFLGIDRTMLEPLGDIKTFGLYSIGFSIANYLGIFFTTLNNTFQPDIFQSIAQHNYKKLLFVSCIVIAVVLICNVVFIIMAPFLIDILTAGRYIDSTPFARILALHNVTLAIFYTVDNIMIGLGYTKQALYIRIVCIFISIIMYNWLINNWQFMGAAWGQVFVFLLLTAFYIVFILLKNKCKNEKE